MPWITLKRIPIVITMEEHLEVLSAVSAESSITSHKDPQQDTHSRRDVDVDVQVLRVSGTMNMRVVRLLCVRSALLLLYYVFCRCG